MAVAVIINTIISFISLRKAPKGPVQNRFGTKSTSPADVATSHCQRNKVLCDFPNPVRGDLSQTCLGLRVPLQSFLDLVKVRDLDGSAGAVTGSLERSAVARPEMACRAAVSLDLSLWLSHLVLPLLLPRAGGIDP